MHCTKISAKFEFGGHSPLGLVAHPKNVTFGYDVGKISAGCLVHSDFSQLISIYHLLRLISWNLTTRCLAVTGGGSVGVCGRLRRPNWLLVCTVIYLYLLLHTYQGWVKVVCQEAAIYCRLQQSNDGDLVESSEKNCTQTIGIHRWTNCRVWLAVNY